MGKHYVRVDKGGGDHGVRWAFLRQVDEIFNPGDYLLVLLGKIFFNCSSLDSFPLAHKSPMNHPL